jgi:hypothetical protein
MGISDDLFRIFIGGLFVDPRHRVSVQSARLERKSKSLHAFDLWADNFL